MLCRICGHNNGDRGKGACSNCGFDLEYQNRPLKEQRQSLQKVLDMPLKLDGSGHLEAVGMNRKGFMGVVLAFLGLAICVFILVTFQRAEITQIGDDSSALADTTRDVPLDSMPILVGSDIVYALNDNGTSADPHTNLNLSLIPEGSTVAFIAPASVPIKPLVAFIDQKNREGSQAKLLLDAICCWTDSSGGEFQRLPLIVQPTTPDTSVAGPVLVKLIFTEQWLVGRVEEFSIEITSALPGGIYSQAKLDSVLTQVSRRLENRDIEGRQVEVTTMFLETTLLGDAFAVMQAVLPSVESRGFRGLGLRYFLLEN